MGSIGTSNSVIATIDEFNRTEFDFVICGGGTAGLVLAARLTENPNVNVGVIEAGKFRKDDPMIDTPGALFSLLGNTEYDWFFQTEPQVSLSYIGAQRRGFGDSILAVYKLMHLGSVEWIHSMTRIGDTSANFTAGRKQQYCTPHAPRKALGWIKRYQLHDVRPWLRRRL
jgi:choline dehydrogenase-like flavoprotein